MAPGTPATEGIRFDCDDQESRTVLVDRTPWTASTGARHLTERAPGARGERDQSRFVVGKCADFPEGTRLIVEVQGRSIGIFKVDGRFHAILNRCPHRGAELCKGDVVGLVESERPGDVRLNRDRKFLVCPWHGWEYELESGQSWYDASRMRARTFSVNIEEGDSLAAAVAEGSARPVDETSAMVVDPVMHRIKGPYVAEVLPISIEDDYVVVSLRAVARPA